MDGVSLGHEAGPSQPAGAARVLRAVTRKLKPGLPPEEARTDVRALFHWLVPVEAALVLEAAWHIQSKGSLSFGDALILGAAQTMDCGFVLSEDMSAGQEIEGIRVVDPFRTPPSDLDR